jgi:hypothetical protein
VCGGLHLGKHSAGSRFKRHSAFTESHQQGVAKAHIGAPALGGKGNPRRRLPCRPCGGRDNLGKSHGAYTRKRRLRYARSLCIGRAKSHEPECHNEGKPRTRQARREAARRPPIPDLPGTSPSVPVSFCKVRSFLGNDVGTGPRPRSRGCDGSLLVAWKAPVGVLGKGAILVANKTQH